VLYDELTTQWQALMDNIAKGDTKTWNKYTFPTGEIRGFGFHEAPRGTLSHWVVIDNGKIKNYQAVVPSTWNAGPRNQHDAMGPYEAALVGNPVADPARPLEVVRTIHSFDPCLACAIHLADAQGQPITKVKVL
jgi:hydrogenase large subunit